MIKDTGERVIPDNMKASNGLLLEHLARYHFSLPFLKGRVLDIACGSGYGAQLIAKSRKKDVSEVMAIDVEKKVIDYAQGRYFHPRVGYYCENAVDPELPDKIGTFDSIVSFETLEHIQEETQFLKNLYNLLSPGGTLILSTPFGKGRGQECGSPFHVHQLTVNEFKSLLDEFEFKSKKYYFQRGVLIEPPMEGIFYPLGLVVCRK
ncbi:MAG: class I SAM-dependent methyltransferase [Bacillota bacterium]